MRLQPLGVATNYEFLMQALTLKHPNQAVKKEALHIHERCLDGRYLNKENYSILVKLQLLLQKLGEFEMASNLRSRFSEIPETDKITDFKIKIDNTILPDNYLNLLPEIRSSGDALLVSSAIRLKRILNDTMHGSPLTRVTNFLRPAQHRILGKRIAIVGPSVALVNRGAEIDGYDLVVRMNIKSDSLLPDKKSHGMRTDIIYLNGLWSERFKTQNYKVLLESQCHFVWRNKNNKHKIKNSHRLVSIENLEISGSLLMLPRLLLDLLRFNPATIDVFCVDFYTGQQKYEPNYKSEGNKKFIWDLANHDILTTLNFVNLILLNSKKSIKFYDLAFGDTYLDIPKFISAIGKE